MAFPPPAQPSAPSLPLPHPEAYPGEPGEYARALMQRKDDIEEEIVSAIKPPGPTAYQTLLAQDSLEELLESVSLVPSNISRLPSEWIR